MDSTKIKLIVSRVADLQKGNARPEDLMKIIREDMNKAPVFAVAIIQYLKDSGFDLMSLKGEEAERFKSKFSPQIEKLNEKDIEQIKKISSKLFRSNS